MCMHMYMCTCACACACACACMCMRTCVCMCMSTQARGLLFSIYAVDAREDTFTQPLTAKSLLRPKEDTRPKSKCVLTLTYT